MGCENYKWRDVFEAIIVPCLLLHSADNNTSKPEPPGKACPTFQIYSSTV